MTEQFNVTNHDPEKAKIMSFGEHLEELRKHIIRAIIVIFVLAIMIFLAKNFVFNKILFAPKDPEFISNKLLCLLGKKFALNTCINKNSISLINIDLAGQFTSHLKVSFIFAFILGFPYLIYELWLFVKPAFKITTIISVRITMFFVALLFFVGVLFGYYIIVPLAINFLTSYQVSEQLVNQIDFQSYISIILSLTFTTGMVFEMPIFVYFLAKLGILRGEFLKKQRKYAVVLAFVISAIITPPDVFSQFLIAIPLLFLYEISIGIAKKVDKKRIINFNA